jgi:hypothetical protein
MILVKTNYPCLRVRRHKYELASKRKDVPCRSFHQIAKFGKFWSTRIVIFIIYKFCSVWENRKAFVSGSDPVNCAVQWSTLTRNGLKSVPATLASGMGIGEPLAPSAHHIPTRPASRRLIDADVVSKSLPHISLLHVQQQDTILDPFNTVSILDTECHRRAKLGPGENTIAVVLFKVPM